MIVRDLIEELQKYDPYSEVSIYIAGTDTFAELVVEDSAVFTYDRTQ
jgi:hypothetical protein